MKNNINLNYLTSYIITYVCIFLMISLAALIAGLPRVVLNGFLHDYYIPMDGGWRVANHQIPHMDFQTPVGLIWYDLLGFMTYVFGPDPRIVPWSSLLFGLFTLALAIPLVFTRFSKVIASLTTTYLFFIAIGPNIYGLKHTVWLATYNTFSWTLFCIVYIGLMFPPVRRVYLWFDSILIGISIGLCFWIKITFGIAILVMVCLLGALRIVNFIRLKYILFYISIFLFLFISPVGQAYIRDIYHVVKYSNADERIKRFLDFYFMNYIGLTISLIVLLYNIYYRQWTRMFIIIIWFLFSYLLQSQNGERGDPLLCLFVLDLTSKINWRSFFLPHFLSVIILIDFNYSYAKSIILAVYQARFYSNIKDYVDVFGDNRLIIASLSTEKSNNNFKNAINSLDGKRSSNSLMVIEDRELNNIEEGMELRIGISMIKCVIMPGDKIANLSFSNPFSFYFGVEPIKNVLQWMDINRNWSPDSISIEEIISDATLIAQPKFSYDYPNSQIPTDFILPKLSDDWRIIQDNEFWAIWRKNNTSNSSNNDEVCNKNNKMR